MKEIKFTPKARLIKILGEQLIKDATVGIIELVKNSYDADAKNVEIVMDSLNSNNAKILIKDDGEGMTLETFTTKWMNPATGHKEEQKENKLRTKLGRLPLGEKGVGRFAAQQIGKHLLMTTKTLDSKKELFVDIDWSKFEERERNLSDVTINYDLQNLTGFSSHETGTVLEIGNLNSIFSEAEIRKVANSLRRMKSPFKGASNFEVKLIFKNCPEEFDKYSNLETTDILDKAHYTFYAIITDDGKIDYEYKFRMPGFSKIEKSGTADLNSETKYKVSKNVTVGDFIVNLHAFDKSKDKLRASDVSDKDLNEWSGVSVYRDGIRILPYGEKGNDWLKLDNRRIQSPSTKIGNDQVIGMVEINQDLNIHLKDKTNREGLIEDLYYEKFTSLILGAVTIFEETLYDDRKRVNPKKEKSKQEDIDSRIDFVLNEIKDISTVIADKNDEESKKAKAALASIGQDMNEFKQRVTDTIDELEKEKQILFNLAGTGLAAERFTHEFARLINGAISSMERLKKRIDINEGKIKKEVDSISGALEALRNDIRLLGPMFYIKKVAKEKQLDIKQIVKSTISLQEHFLIKEGIEMEIEGDTFNVTMREGSCMQIFNNLIDNAIYWTGRKSEADKKQIKVIIDSKTNSVYVTDSGPGISTRYRDKIFDPFFSMKGEDGRGLGLYIVKEILEEKNFSIFIVDKEDYSGLLEGASFRVILKASVE